MEQIKIGKFIAAQRREQSMTQRQLADILHINVNELLSGEQLTGEDYRRKAEEHVMEFVREREENRKMLRVSIFIGVLATEVFLGLILLASFYTDVIGVPVVVATILFAYAVFGAGVFWPCCSTERPDTLSTPAAAPRLSPHGSST